MTNVPFGSGDDPLGSMANMFNQLIGALSGGTQSWEHAKALAASIANDGQPEPNIDPIERIHIEQLARVAELHVREATGLGLDHDGSPVQIVPANRSQWATAGLDAYRPLFEQLTNSLGAVMREQLGDVNADDLTEFDPNLNTHQANQFLAGLHQMLGPMMLSLMAGSTIGQLGRRAFGSYDLPIPRPLGEPVYVVADTIDQFSSDWSLPADDVHLWVCIQEYTHRAVLGIPHVRDHISALLSEHASGFEANPDGIEARLGDVDMSDAAGMEQLQLMLSDPDVVLGAIRSDAQAALLPRIDAIVTVVEGYVDAIVDEIAARLLTSAPQLAEALRRRRVEIDQASRFVERLFGLELTQPKLDRGTRFIEGVIERAGRGALAQLWSGAEALPTPTEVDAPGLWLARMGLESDELPGLPEDVGEVPDFPDLDA